MRSAVKLFCSPLPPISEKEIRRYCGVSKEGTFAFPEELMRECEQAIKPSLCYRVFPLTVTGDKVFIPEHTFTSRLLAENLAGYTHVILTAATLGLNFDRVLNKYSALSPSRAVLCQGYGAERIEALCDLFCRNLKEKCAACAPRFSPGYADLSLTYQNQILSLLDAENTIGIHTTDSHLLCPSKSVTSFIGTRGIIEEL